MIRALACAAVVACLTAPPRLAAQPADAPHEWVARGEQLFRAERYKESIAAYERGLQLRAPDAHVSAWHIARAYARLGNAKQASRWLMHARQFGFSDERAIAAEPGLSELLERAGVRNRRLLRVPTVCARICGSSSTLPSLRT